MSCQPITEYDEEIIQLYDAGWSMRYIAQRLGVSRWTVAKRLKLHDIPIRSISEYDLSRIPHKEIDRTIFLYHHCGLTIREVARIMGFASTNSVQWRLTRAGAPPRRGQNQYTRDHNANRRPVSVN